MELEEIRNEAYTNARIVRNPSKKYHDSRILRKDLQPGDRVLLYDSRLHLFPGKLRSRWKGPYRVLHIFPYGAFELKNEQDGSTFKVNGGRLKKFQEEIKEEEQVLELGNPNYDIDQ